MFSMIAWLLERMNNDIVNGKAIILAVNRKHQKEIMEELDADGDTTVLIPDIPEDF